MKKPNVGQDYWDRHLLVTFKPGLLELITKEESDLIDPTLYSKKLMVKLQS